MWRHPSIPAAMPETLFNNFAAGREPTTPLPADAAEIGFVSIDPHWCAWYRFYFGGDIRRKRHILACAFIRRSQMQPAATLGPWDANPVAGLAESAPRQCPLTPPNILEAEWSPPPAHPDPTLLREWQRGGEWAYEGTDYAQQTLAACALLSQNQTFHCRISQRANTTRVALTVRSDTASAPTPATSPPPARLAPKPLSQAPQPQPLQPPRGAALPLAPGQPPSLLPHSGPRFSAAKPLGVPPSPPRRISRIRFWQALGPHITRPHPACFSPQRPRPGSSTEPFGYSRQTRLTSNHKVPAEVH